MKTKFSAVLITLLLLSTAVFAQAELDAKLAAVDAYARKAQADWNIPGMALAIVKDDKVVFAKGYGIQKLGGGDKVDADTLFAIASNSKAFTTASLAILIDEGKIGGWDDKVSKYLPGFELYDPYVTEALTIRDLVSHRVGLDTFSGDLLWYETNYSTEEILKRLKHL
ncbi:MAG: beta-lactamase family protein, partial [Acidobacteriota bacterium]|nr:beta-lactamase family protein [Acidobacteriota bacterium]